MSKDRGYLRTLSCSLSLSSCRLRAEALARALNSRLWSRTDLTLSRRDDTYERLLTDSRIASCSGMANIIDKPPRNQETFKSTDLKEIGHCWVNEMPVEEDELFDTPPCSSPPSPADEEIILNPPSPLPFCTKFLREFNAEYRSCGSKDHGHHMKLPDEEKLRDKLQQYAEGLLLPEDSVETFYDASDDDRKNECGEVNKCSPNCNVDRLDSNQEKCLLQFVEDDTPDSGENSGENSGEKSPENSSGEDNLSGTKSTTDDSKPQYADDDHLLDSSTRSPCQTDSGDGGSDSGSTCVSSLCAMDRRDSDEQELDDEHRPRLLRSTSLKTGKTPPGTPGRKKIVRFADVLGLDLEAVRHIVCEDLPNVPSSAFKDLKVTLEEPTAPEPAPKPTVVVPSSTWESVPTASGSALSNLFPLFRPPGGDPDFLDRVRRDFVCLEAITVSVHSVHVVCRVLNLSYEKQVACRYSTDEWKSWDEVVASYVPFSSDGEFDRFSFSLFLPLCTGSNNDVSFAIRYAVGGKEHWDNNVGQNYTLRYHSSGANGASALLIPESETQPPWLHHFF